MKYIFLFILTIFTSTLSAATTIGNDGTINSSTGGSDATINSGGSFGSINTYQDPGLGGNINTAPIGGGGNTNTGVIGGGGVAHPVQLQELPKPKQTVSGFIVWFIGLLNYVLMAMLTGALLFFLYGVLLLMFVNGTNEESRSKGKKFMLWGIVSLFVMVSVWGLVNVLKTSVFGTTTLIFPSFK